MQTSIYAQKYKKDTSVNRIMSSVSQKKPTIMILPSDNWCNLRYYMTTYDNQGTKIKTPDYKLAFQQDPELNPVISRVGQLLTSIGYSLKDAEQEIKSIDMKTAEDNMTFSKAGCASLSESPLDIIKRRLKSDILIQLSWGIGSSGNTFTIEAFDTYTNKRIATATGNMSSGTSVVDQLFNSVNANIKPFDCQMIKWYKDLQENGREINLIVRCWDDWDNDLETEYNGEELTDCIQTWLRSHTINGNFNFTDGSETFAQFEQVRIPLADGNGNAIDARTFGTQLRKYLALPPFSIPAKVMQRGLGEVIIVLGEK